MPHPSAQNLLMKYEIRPKKRLGQNFLTATSTIEKIVRALDLKRDDIVLEIGSGLGLMTAMLAERCKHVVAVEHDTKLVEIANEEFKQIKNISWINENVLKLNLKRVLDECTNVRTYECTKLVGNIPYNISSPILFWLLDNREPISTAVIMVQKEVGLRIVAKPGCKDYGITSVLTQAYAECKRLFDVSAASFIPPPKVISTVVKFDFKDNAPIKDKARFRMIVRAAFGKRRKTLRNALIGSKELCARKNVIDIALCEAGIDGKLRAEALSVDDYIRLARELKSR